MAKKKHSSTASVDQITKAMLVLSRTVEYVLGSHAVEMATIKPLSTSKVQIIHLLAQRSSQTFSQIARYLNVSKPAVSQIIDSMIRAKLVKRKTSKEDRREVNLTLTEKGKNIHKLVRQQQRHCVRLALRNINGVTTGRWINALNDIACALGKSDNAFLKHCMQCGAHEDGSCVLVDGDAKCHFLAYEPRTVRAVKNKKAVKKTC